LLAFILVFLDDGITWHLINHPSHKLTHGDAYNYDTVIIGVMIGVNSILGLPWLVAATVRSLNHVHALAEKSPSGKIISVLETRLTHLGIHLLCFVSIFALEALKLIPMPVLYGVFLYMGLVSLGTNQFWGRFIMFFMEPSQYPHEFYTQYMKPSRMHLFTVIQGAVFILLYVVKAIKPISIAFPVIIALCIPIRLYLLPRIFTEEELIVIDSSDKTVMKYLEKKLAEEKGVVDTEAPVDKDNNNNDDDNNIDQSPEDANDFVSALPSKDDTDIGRRRQERRRNRKKTLSCPQNLFFPETGTFGSTAVNQNQEDVVTEEDDSVQSSEDEADLAPLPTMTMPLRGGRRKKTKTLSCPTHMLFKEANKNVNENYFFG